MDNFILPESVVSDLTGYKSARKQIEYLKKQGIPFILSSRGQPKIFRSWVEEAPIKHAVKDHKKWSPSLG